MFNAPVSINRVTQAYPPSPPPLKHVYTSNVCNVLVFQFAPVCINRVTQACPPSPPPLIHVYTSNVCNVLVFQFALVCTNRVPQVPLCVADGRSRNPLYYYYYYQLHQSFKHVYTSVCLTPSCLRRGTCGDRDPRKWEKEGDYTKRYTQTSTSQTCLH